MASLPSTRSPDQSTSTPIIHDDDSDEYGSEIDVLAAVVTATEDSDYGSDWDSTIVDHLTKSESSPLPEIVILEGELIPDEEKAQTHSLRLARVRSSQDDGDDGKANGLASPPPRPQRMPSVEVEYDERNRVSFTCESCHPFSQDIGCPS